MEVTEATINRILDKLDGYIERHSNEHQKVWAEISTLKVKATAWGAIGGLAVIVAGILISYLTNMIRN